MKTLSEWLLEILTLLPVFFLCLFLIVLSLDALEYELTGDCRDCVLMKHLQKAGENQMEKYCNDCRTSNGHRSNCPNYDENDFLDIDDYADEEYEQYKELLALEDSWDDACSYATLEL